MGKIINSVTKNRQSNEVIAAMTEKAFCRSFEQVRARELAGGLCNAVYLVECDDKRAVLKIASSAEVVTMRHEKDYVKCEALMLKEFGEKLNIKMPQLIYFDESRTICSEPYFFMTFVEGEPLISMEKRPNEKHTAQIKYELGEICGAISSLKSDYFGIPMLKETYTKSNCDFMLKMFSMLLDDISGKGKDIPYITSDRLMSLIESRRRELDEVTQAVYVHTDTWDGNLMIKDNKLSALIDYAAILYGDPLLTHDFHDFAPQPDENFCRGFGKESFSESEKIRIIVYKIWHRLGMIAECAFRNYDDPDQYSWVWGEFEKAVKELEQI